MKKSKLLMIFIFTIFLLGSLLIIKSMIRISQADASIKEEKNELISNEMTGEANKEVNQFNNTTIKNQEEKVMQNNQLVEESEISNKKEKRTVEKTYFDDALFIGDSRTVGISEYGNLNNATFFANTGMSVYNVLDKTVSVPRVGKLKLDQLLTSKKFGKIYIMLGINELGYDQNSTIKKYEELIKYIQNKQDNSIIYVQANLHVTAKKSNKDKTINNMNIDHFNNEISKLADNKKIFYIDINERFDDESGNLDQNYTQDNVHIYAKYYKEWSDWLSQNAI